MRVIGTVRTGREIVGDGEACDAGPAIADFEKLERIDEGMDLFFGELLFEDDREDAGRAGEIAFEEFVAGTRGKRRMQDQLDLGTRYKPLRESERGFFDSGEADGERF